jgi:hypothetical protein
MGDEAVIDKDMLQQLLTTRPAVWDSRDTRAQRPRCWILARLGRLRSESLHEYVAVGWAKQYNRGG